MSIIKHAWPPNIQDIYNESFSNQLAKTQAAVVSLNQSRRLLHEPSLLMRPILIKEAEASSRLEGTQASIDDVYKIDIEEQTKEKREDIAEIKNYEAAMLYGIELVKRSGKLNNFVIREIHKTLMQGVRGKDKKPGKFRKEKVWIGSKGTNEQNARYTPPDAVYVESLMEQLENYILGSNENDTNPLIACGIIHHRFEAIHPFMDGNGRAGRLLISLYLIFRNLLHEPMLYASGYFESNRQKYMDSLSAVDNSEDWSLWLGYFLTGLERQATKSLELALEINDLYRHAEGIIKGMHSHVPLLQALEHCFAQPFTTAPRLHDATSIPVSTCRKYLSKLASKGILQNLGLIKGQRVYVSHGLMKVLRSI